MIAAAKSATRIWLVEDHQVFAKQILRLIGSVDDLICAHHFSNAAELFDKLKFTNERPDLLLLDLGLPRRDGIEVLGDIRRLLPKIKVLILTASEDREKVYRTICGGASGYLLKTAAPDEILAGIRDVILGASTLSASITSMILQGFARYGPVAHVDPLTHREEDVLRFLVKGLIKKEIADQLDISSHTVDMHLRSVYRKLQVRSQTEAVSVALRQGIV